MNMYDYLSSFDLLKFDRILLIDLSNKLFSLKTFPYFIIAHAIGVCLSLKDELDDRSFSRKHPLSCWFSTMLSIYAGSFLANFLLGHSILIPFKNEESILYSTAVWYIMFYSPFDIAYNICNFFPVKVIISVAKELYRCRAVYDGVNIAMKTYPTSFLIVVMIGTIKGVGSLIIRNFERSMRGIWVPNSSEILQPTASTKICLISAIIFTLNKMGIAATQFPTPILFSTVFLFMAYLRLSALLFHINDPFAGAENVFCTIFMGGVWDALQKTYGGSFGNLTSSSGSKGFRDWFMPLKGKKHAAKSSLLKNGENGNSLDSRYSKPPSSHPKKEIYDDDDNHHVPNGDLDDTDVRERRRKHQKYDSEEQFESRNQQDYAEDTPVTHSKKSHLYGTRQNVNGGKTHDLNETSAYQQTMSEENVRQKANQANKKPLKSFEDYSSPQERRGNKKRD